jgi:hypothetical protein
MNVAILGASDKPSRFAYKAQKQLIQHGHQTFLVSPNLQAFEGQVVVPRLTDISAPIDTVTMYVGPQISSGLIPDFLSLRPKRVIFNPGSENPKLAEALKKSGVHVVEACTLVLLSIGQFEQA